MSAIGSYLPFIIFLLILLFNSIKILQEYERGVIFFLGRLTGVRGPGLIFLIQDLRRCKKWISEQ